MKYKHLRLSAVAFVYAALLLLVVLGLPATSGTASLYAENNNNTFTHISLEHGLSQVSVSSIQQDRHGFMWFATEAGINRYDGYGFIIYDYMPDSPYSLSDSAVTVLLIDRDDVLWAGTRNGGLNRLAPGSKRFQHYQHNPGNPFSIGSDDILAIYENPCRHEPFLWLGTRRGGLARFERGAGKFKCYKHDPANSGSICHDVVTSICAEKREGANILWIGTKNGLERFDATSETFYHFGIGTDGERRIHPEIDELLFTAPHSLWVGTNGGGLYRINVKTGRIADHFTHNGRAVSDRSIPDNYIRALFEDSRGRVWLGTEKGLSRYDPDTRHFRHYENIPSISGSLSDNRVVSIFEDTSGVMWVGTWVGGVNKFDGKPKRFRTFSHIPGNPNSLRDDAVFSVIADTADENLWIGTRLGLEYYDREKQKFTHYRAGPGKQGGLSFDFVSEVYEDCSKVIWVGTRRGLNRFDRDLSRFTHYFHDPADSASLSHNNIICIIDDPRDKENFLWVGTREKGLNRFEKKTGKCRRYIHQPGDPTSIAHDKIYSFLAQHDGTLWIGTWGGLNRYEPDTDRFSLFQHEPSNPASINNDRITVITADPENPLQVLWLGTWGGGLNRFDIASGHAIHYSIKSGLQSNLISGIIPDENGYFWVSSPKGICRFDPRNGEVTNYKVQVGTRENAFNAQAFFKVGSGEMLFGGIRGLTTFFPKNMIHNPHIPPIVLTSFKVFNKEVANLRELPGVRQVDLSYQDKFLSFEFAALEYTFPEKNRYAYKMDGFDPDWNYTDSRKRYASYTNLEPGTYTFRVKGSNNDNIWNTEGCSIKIVIVPPFWQKLWFKVLLAVVVMLIAFFVAMARVNSVERQKKELTELVETRTGELRRSRDELARINTIVKSINSEVDLIALLESVLKETFVVQGMEKASALVYNRILDRFSFKASIGWDINELRGAHLTPKEAEDRYIKNSREIHENIFVAKDIKGRPGEDKIRHLGIAKTMLILRIQVRGEVSGYLIFDNMWDETVFEEQNLRLLDILKDHITSAFLKIKLMMEQKTTNRHLHETRQKAERQREIAEAASRSKSEFLARMSHEIRTPMNSVIGFAEMLQDSGLSDEQYEYARTISLSGEALLSLINDILDFSKIEAGHLTMEPIDFDPEVTAFNVCDLMLPRIGAKPIELLCRVGDNVPAFVKSDPGRFRQVLVNLLGNAVKFTEKGEIELSIDMVEETEDRLKLHASVRDTGVGIPKNKLDTIFEVFQQADGSTTRKFGGTGLGLTICKQIARLMHGDIHVESRLGEGSIFHFTAWVAKSRKRPTRRIPIQLLVGKRVLIVDDNLNNLDILEHTLTTAKMIVTCLADGRDVISLLKGALDDGEPFDLCILDIQMPVISGYDVAKRIRTHKTAIAGTTLLAFSSSVVRHARKCKDAGFDGFLPKPAHRRKLLYMVQRLLGQKKDHYDENMTAPAPKTIVTAHTLTEDAKHAARILLVEDHPVNQKLARYMLEKAGYQLEIATNGKEAVEAFMETPNAFDLIFMDVQMPEMDGKEATRFIRAKGYTDIPIIAMTAQTMKGDREKCLAAGMNDYIAKPIKRQVVFEMLKKWFLRDKE